MNWIPLGHVIRYLSNPDSVSFKCPFCGYELYTLYGLGVTNECPSCGTKLTFEDKNLQKLAEDFGKRRAKGTMIVSDGYTVEYFPKNNQIVITLPQTFKTISNTVQMVVNRKVDITNDDLVPIMSLVKYICEG